MRVHRLMKVRQLMRVSPAEEDTSAKESAPVENSDAAIEESKVEATNTEESSPTPATETSTTD